VWHGTTNALLHQLPHKAAVCQPTLQCCNTSQDGCFTAQRQEQSNTLTTPTAVEDSTPRTAILQPLSLQTPASSPAESRRVQQAPDPLFNPVPGQQRLTQLQPGLLPSTTN